MSVDALARLAAANPVPAEARSWVAQDLRLEELRLRLGSVPGRRLKRRIVLAAAAPVVLAAAVALVAPALGLRFGWIDFFGAQPAPPRVVKDFASLSEGAPPGMDPNVIPGETRKVTTVTLSSGEYTLWVAPTTPGGLCFQWSKGVGGCDRNGDIPLAVSWMAPRGVAPPGSAEDFQLVAGHVHAPWVDGVEIELSDGSTIKPDVTWVSPPIDAGFFLYEAPNGLSIRSVVATKRGEAVDSDTLGSGRMESGMQFADVSKRRVIESIETSAGTATLWQAPTKTDKVCTWLEVAGARHSIAPCLPRDDVQGISAGAVNAGDTQIVWALVGPTYRELVFRFDDGTTDVVRPFDGVVLHAAPADAHGTLVARQRDGTLAPGFTLELPLPPTAK
jgi:hypothetical protein